MFGLPPIPSWDGLHPLMIHFPIALMFVAPIFVVLAVLIRKHAGGLLLAASGLMIISAVTAIMAVSTGEAASDLAEKVPGAGAILENHEKLGEQARTLTVLLALAMCAGTIGYIFKAEKAPGKLWLGLAGLYLLGHGFGAIVIAKAGHEGGRLVHEVGVKAWAKPGGTGGGGGGGERKRENGEKDDERGEMGGPTVNGGGTTPTARGEGLKSAMRRVDKLLDGVLDGKVDSWSKPAEHAGKAKELEELLRGLMTNQRVKEKPEDFRTMMETSIAHAGELRALLLQEPKAEAKTIDGKFEKLAASCEECHAKYKD